MNKNILLILLQMTVSITLCLAQNKEQSPVYLSNYTFSIKGNEIGYVKIRHAQEMGIKSISIAGEHAGAVKVGKDRKLSISKGRLKSDITWFDIVLTVNTSAGEFKDTFRIVKDGFIRNKVIAHRGAWKNTGADENSVAALQHAISMGCEGSEFDVHMSADSLLFINHDPLVQGISIAKSTSAQLSAIRLTNGEALPTLQNYIEAGTRQNKTKLILEIKASELGKESSISRTRKVVTLVEKLNAQAWVDYISFDYEVCKEIMKMAPYAKVAYLMGDKTPAQLAEANFFGLDYHFKILEKNPNWIREAKQKQLTINVWTVNDQKTMEGLLKEKVDFITTNEPELLLDLIHKK